MGGADGGSPTAAPLPTAPEPAPAKKRAGDDADHSEAELQGGPGAKRRKVTDFLGPGDDMDSGGHGGLAPPPAGEGGGDLGGASGAAKPPPSADENRGGEPQHPPRDANPYLAGGQRLQWRPHRTFVRPGECGAAASKNPGGKIYPHGNYRGYYCQRFMARWNAAGDPRLRSLPEGFFKHKRVLDVGCNAGHVAIEIAAKLGAKRVVGVDIDEQLVKEARGNVVDAWSLTKPAAKEDPECPKKQADADADTPLGYFPSCMPAIFGRRKVPSGRKRFPVNLEFVAGDWLQDAKERDRPGSFDVVLALSLTKWIHLNHGDAGIRKLFNKIHAVLSPGGKFVLEAQPYEKYKKVKSLTPTISENYKRIRMTAPDAFERYLLENVDFESVERIETPKDQGSGFRRPLLVFTKRQRECLDDPMEIEVERGSN